MIVVAAADARCDCTRAVELVLRADVEDASAEAIAAAYLLVVFVARLTARARGWAVGDDVVCDCCVERPDAGTVYQDGLDA